VKFAEELKAVMDAVGLKRPILVGWSFGARIIADYLLKYGSARNQLHSPAISPNPAHFGPGIKKLAEARDADFATSIRGTREFLRACFLKELAKDEFETMLVYNASVPLEIRGWFGRPASDTESLQRLLRSLALPVLVSHGLEDQVILPELSRWLKTIIPAAKLSFHQESGHAPFFEDSKRFNRELEAFAAQTSQSS
jgi:non-heme chloroperoxidase